MQARSNGSAARGTSARPQREERGGVYCGGRPLTACFVNEAEKRLISGTITQSPSTTATAAVSTKTVVCAEIRLPASALPKYRLMPAASAVVDYSIGVLYDSMTQAYC